MNGDENSKSTNGFDAQTKTNQKKLQKEKKSLNKTKESKKTRHLNKNDFISANKFYTEEYSYMSFEDQIANEDNGEFQMEEEEQKPQPLKMEIYEKQGYSNKKLNPSENSGLETNLEINLDNIQYWYYTLGKSFRDYQYKIVQTCLSNNTLVALPTGLGKTFVAATVILNYYLWYPKGKIFFLAPTRPLVNQQIECLKHFELINQNDIFEMTGNFPIPKRQDVYNRKRIFFQTPQTLENDLQEGRYDGNNLCLVIFDEAHRATGKYAYVNIVKQFEILGFGYRILGLSATPGNEFDQIQEVLKSLCISKLEIKDEEDADVNQYIHSKQIIPVKIQGNDFINRITGFNYLKNKKLIPIQHYKIVKSPKDISKGVVFSILQFIQSKQNQIMEEETSVGLSDAYDQHKTLASLSRGNEIITKEGINSFKQWLHDFEFGKQNVKDKPNQKQKTSWSKQKVLVHQDFIDLKKLLNMDSFMPYQNKKEKQKKSTKNLKEQKNKNNLPDIDKEEDYGYEDNNAPFIQNINGKSEMNNENEVFYDLESHPKSIKLVELLTNYFLEYSSIQNKSKTIVFTQSRNSAAELKRLLNNLDICNEDGTKLIRGEIFIGQANQDGQGMNQKLQIETISQFKKNVHNTLIATCIGEEGLDIGEVDLIICYDSVISPIRMIQRMGRTGRNRAGKVYVLLMEGKEFGSFQTSQKKHKELIKLLKNNSCSEGSAAQPKGKGRQSKLTSKAFEFYGYNPRMIPSDINPSCRIIKSSNNEYTPSVESDAESEEDVFQGFIDPNQNLLKEQILNKGREQEQLKNKMQNDDYYFEKDEFCEESSIINQNNLLFEQNNSIIDLNNSIINQNNEMFEQEHIIFDKENPLFNEQKPKIKKEKLISNQEKVLLNKNNKLNQGKLQFDQQNVRNYFEKKQFIDEQYDLQQKEQIIPKQQNQLEQQQVQQKNLLKIQRDKDVQERLLQLVNNINGKKQNQIKQTPSPLPKLTQTKLATPETMTPFSSSNKTINYSTSGGYKKKSNIFEPVKKQTQLQFKKFDSNNQVNKIPLKSNSKKSKLIISDSENTDFDDINNQNRTSFKQNQYLTNNQNNYSRQQDFNSYQISINNNIFKTNQLDNNLLNMENDIKSRNLEVEFERSDKQNNINKQQNSNLKQNSKSTFEFNSNDYSYLYDSNQSDYDQIINTIDQKDNSFNNPNKQLKQVQGNYKDSEDKDSDSDNDDELDIQRLQAQLKLNQNKSQNKSLDTKIYNNYNSQIISNKQYSEDLFCNNQQQQQQQKINDLKQTQYQNKLDDNKKKISPFCQDVQTQNEINYPSLYKNPVLNQQNTSEQQNQNSSQSKFADIYKMIDENSNSEDEDENSNSEQEDDDSEDDIEYLKSISSCKNKTQNIKDLDQNGQQNPQNKLQCLETNVNVLTSQNKFQIQQNLNQQNISKNQLNPIENQQNKFQNQHNTLQTFQNNNCQTQQDTLQIKKNQIYQKFQFSQEQQSINNQVNDSSDSNEEEDLESLMKLKIFNKSNIAINSNKNTQNNINSTKNNIENIQIDNGKTMINENVQQNVSSNKYSIIEQTSENKEIENNIFNKNNQNSNSNIDNKNQFINQTNKSIQPQQIIKVSQNDSQICNHQFQVQQNLVNNKQPETIVKNFSGIKEVIEDQSKQIISIDNKSISVINKSNPINLLNSDSQTSSYTNQTLNNINSNINQNSDTNQPASNYISQTSNSELNIQKKNTCDLLLEQIKKSMENDFDQKEYEFRNKNKVVESPKYDPKKSRSKKKIPQKEEKIQSSLSVQDTSKKLLEQDIESQNGQRSRENILSEAKNQRINQLESKISTNINLQNQQMNEELPKQQNQNKQQDQVNPFKYLQSNTNDSEEDDDTEFIKSYQQHKIDSHVLKNEDQNFKITQQIQQKRKNPYMNNPDSSYNTVKAQKKQYKKK